MERRGTSSSCPSRVSPTESPHFFGHPIPWSVSPLAGGALWATEVAPLVRAEVKRRAEAAALTA